LKNSLRKDDDHGQESSKSESEGAVANEGTDAKNAKAAFRKSGRKGQHKGKEDAQPEIRSEPS
jgi:hypothetical protein